MQTLRLTTLIGALGLGALLGALVLVNYTVGGVIWSRPGSGLAGSSHGLLPSRASALADLRTAASALQFLFEKEPPARASETVVSNGLASGAASRVLTTRGHSPS